MIALMVETLLHPSKSQLQNMMKLSQDPQTRQILGIGHKHGRLFELIHLRSPHKSSTAVAASTMSSFHLWRCHLGLVSFSRLKSLVSSGQLGHVHLEDVDCLSCQIAKQLPYCNALKIMILNR
ncbi:hypothetical protein LOK49_LG04G02979 [Camellia lanceoleosa]|uniref:Uncharacterized protein n=1 Tax=Camellia lanceoleosa TaxID=1840588 RepID=A0ACC0I1S0_9ERIC|nr:hypothetical protein LOK49_LG04G02979 [Camellia lanceoleosa]